MNRNEKRRKLKECRKELVFIEKHTPYLLLKDSKEFDLPKAEIELLMASTHENKVLQTKFDLAKKIFTRVDQLKQVIELLEKPATNKEAHPESL